MSGQAVYTSNGINFRILKILALWLKRNTPRRGGIAIEWIGAIDQALRRSAILEEALIAICPLRGQNKLAFPYSIAISPLRGVHSLKSN